VEVTGDYDWITHGEAVAIGTVLETRIATSKKLCSLEESQKIDAIFRKLHILENIDLTKINPEKCWKAILLDKKNRNDNIRFVLPEKIGKVKLVQPILEEDVEVAFGSLQHIGEE